MLCAAESRSDGRERAGGGENEADTWLASLEALYVPKWQSAYGFRLDLAQRESPVYVPFLSYHIPGDGNVVRFVLEGRFRGGNRPTIVFEINFLH